MGKPHTDEIAALLIEHPERVEDAARIYEQHLFGGTFTDCLTAAPDVSALLNRLDENYELALVTGVHPRLLTETIFEKFDIPPVFEVICSTYDLADASLAKPNPYVANLLLEQFELEPEDAVVIGDARNDVLLAQNAGIEPIVVLSGHLTRSEAVQMGVTHVIVDITHIESELDRIQAAYPRRR